LISRAIDIVLIWTGFVLAHQIIDLEWSYKSSVLFMVSLITFQFLGEVFGLYLPLRNKTALSAVIRLLAVIMLMQAVLAVGAWASRQPYLISERMLFVWWMVFGGMPMILLRLILRYALVYLRKRGYNSKQAAVVGNGDAAQKLIKKLRENPWMGIEIYGIYVNSETSSGTAPFRGDLDAVVEAARCGVIDHVYIALPMTQEDQIRDLVDALMDSTVSIFFIPDIFAFNLMNARQDSICGLPAISLVDGPLSVAGSIIKRLVDIFGSLAILIVIAMPMMMIALAVKITSDGPVIFRQQRYGVDGKAISVWKFRSMTTMDNGDCIRQATVNDSRLTSIGGFLRRTSLDELPQFFNVLQGHMSIVGPRPHAVAHNEFYRTQIKGYMMRHKVKPGITGWAQVHGYRGETDTLEKMQKRIEYDLEYISNWSLWMDIKILFMTIIGGFMGKNAY
jgi:putative colanic acid biosynthesis UDP-glucose lipid carrier transferase